MKAAIVEDPSLPDEQKERWFCFTCQKCKFLPLHWLMIFKSCVLLTDDFFVGLGELDYVTHKHDKPTGEYSDAIALKRNPDLFWVMSPRWKDLYRILLYRTCDKEAVINGSTAHPGAVRLGTISKCILCETRKQPSTLTFLKQTLMLMKLH